MADIKKNAKAGNMVSGSSSLSSMVWDRWVPGLSRLIQLDLLTVERMQDPCKRSSPYTTVYSEIHPDASPAPGGLAPNADVKK
jgi:hypothetical protein